ncbi:lysozyme [Kushneria sinocarnis]|uniref:Lysozyme n=1 Tax=Kushneria sinocarnis TaxID=595502 RepID=A0A420WVM4_9GAMM|nr:lysozyme [Kushneria sinocarnis]RKR02606.1 lysozyme [Kushneria sinocarnis]
MIPPILKRLGLPVAGTAIGIAGATVGHFEGTKNEAYRDPVGIPTICTGHTGPSVHMGQTKTDAECRELLEGDLSEAFKALKRNVNPDVLAGMPDTRKAALASFIYNVGAGAFRRSTLLEKLNRGNVAGACHELDRWVMAGGQQLPGLVRRRAAERALCLMGLQKDDRR